MFKKKKYKPTRYKESTPEENLSDSEKDAVENFEGSLSSTPETGVSVSFENGGKRGNKRKNSWIFIVLIVIFSLVFVFSLAVIIRETLAEYETEKSISNLQTLIPKVPEKEEPTPDVPIDPTRIFSISDFSQLQAVNEDTIGWFYMPCYTESTGLPIDIALVHGNDDSFYLNHDFYKNESINGWVYVSSDCNGEDIRENRNLLVYGHARSNQMFGGLKNLNLDTEWQANTDSHYIKISTPYENSVWEIFSWHETTVDDFYWQTSFSSDEEFLEFAYRVQGQDQLGCFSEFEFTADDRIMTLSTCKGLDENVRVAVHAKLIVSEQRDLPEE